MKALTELERYRFDIQGYLLVPQVLGRDELAGLNAALDANADRLNGAEDATQGSPALAGEPRHQWWDMVQCRSPA